MMYAAGNMPTLGQVFKDYAGLPSFITWTPTKIKGKIKKKPDTRTNNYPFKPLLRIQKYPGLVFDENHNLICLDIDGNYPPGLRDFVDNHPTYVEKSASGKTDRLHVFYRVPLNLKKTLKPKQVFPSKVELFSHSANFVALTGEVNGDVLAIRELTEVNSLLQALNTEQLSPEQMLERVTQVPDGGILGSTTSLKAQKSLSLGITLSDWSRRPYLHPEVWVDVVPASESQAKPLIDRLRVNYYSWWLQGLMSLHSLQDVPLYEDLDLLAFAHDWSERSGVYDEDEVNDKWASFSSDGSINVNTYFSTFIQSVDWAKTTAVPKSHSSMPTSSELNIQSLMNALSIRNCQCEVSKEAYIQVKYLSFQDYLLNFKPFFSYDHSFNDNQKIKVTESVLDALAQFVCLIIHKSSSNVLDLVRKQLRTQTLNTNELKEQIERIQVTEPDLLKVVSEDVVRSPDPLASTYIRKWLLSLGRTMWGPYSQKPTIAAEGMVVLHSINSRKGKTTFPHCIMPDDLAHWAQKLDADFSSNSRDFYLSCNKTLIVNLDEMDQYISSSKSVQNKLKSFITSANLTTRPMYARENITSACRFSLIGSTNSPTLPLDSGGLRRFWWVPVDENLGIDIRLMLNLDRVQLFCQIKYELEKADYSMGQFPWALSDDDKDTTEIINMQVLTKNDCWMGLDLSFNWGNYDLYDLVCHRSENLETMWDAPGIKPEVKLKLLQHMRGLSNVNKCKFIASLFKIPVDQLNFYITGKDFSRPNLRNNIVKLQKMHPLPSKPYLGGFVAKQMRNRLKYKARSLTFFTPHPVGFKSAEDYFVNCVNKTF